MPTLPQLQVDAFLTGISIAYMNAEFAAEQVFPDLPVDARSDKYWVYNRDAFLRTSGLDSNGKSKSLRKDGGVANVIEHALSSDQYYTENYAHRELVTDAVVRNAAATPGSSMIQPRVDATLQLSARLAMDKEEMAAYKVGKTSLYPTANKVTLTTNTTSWAAYTSATSLPLNNIRDGKLAVRRSLLREPNTALYTVDSAQVLADHPTIKDLVKYTHQDALTSAGLPKVLRGLSTVEAAAQKITSNEGAANTSGNIWVDSSGYNLALVFYKSPETGPRSVHFGRTFCAPNPTTGIKGVSIRPYRDEARGGEWLEGDMTIDIKHISVDDSSLAIGGYLISGTDL
ncbi:hypothetical protein [Armatimonas sp.]|uniref:hypothetical protein n=1 Tax=Armatimonas sp. TaxID=1872638 RepID=UPI0037509B9E